MFRVCLLTRVLKSLFRPKDKFTSKECKVWSKVEANGLVAKIYYSTTLYPLSSAILQTLMSPLLPQPPFRGCQRPENVASLRPAESKILKGTKKWMCERCVVAVVAVIDVIVSVIVVVVILLLL